MDTIQGWYRWILSMDNIRPDIRPDIRLDIPNRHPAGHPARHPAGHPARHPAGHPSQASQPGLLAPQPGRDTPATRRLMLEPKILIFHWFFKQKWSAAPAGMGARASIEPLKKPLEPQSDKLFGEKENVFRLFFALQGRTSRETGWFAWRERVLLEKLVGLDGLGAFFLRKSCS